MDVHDPPPACSSSTTSPRSSGCSSSASRPRATRRSRLATGRPPSRDRGSTTPADAARHHDADDGRLERLEQLQQLPEDERPRVVVVSARSSLPDRAKAAELGADAFVAKPFNVDDLLGVLHGLERAELSTRRSSPPVAYLAAVTPSHAQVRPAGRVLLIDARDRELRPVSTPRRQQVLGNGRRCRRPGGNLRRRLRAASCSGGRVPGGRRARRARLRARFRVRVRARERPRSRAALPRQDGRLEVRDEDFREMWAPEGIETHGWWSVDELARPTRSCIRRTLPTASR